MPFTQERPQSFVILGDTQRTMLYQILLGKEANNHEERLLLIEHIQKRRPEFVALLGDLVAWGHSEKDWAYFDSVMAPLASTPLYPALGNHDYFFFKNLALEKIQVRFPELKEKTYYTKCWGPLALVFLDTNFSVLDKATWKAQLHWLQEELQCLEKDQSVRGILLLGHYPPYTNSFEVSPHVPTRKDILPLFHQSQKTLAFMSGHCHAYERFEFEGKCFIVSGGGGGPRQALREGPLMRWKDLWPGGRTRPFHYLWVGLGQNGLVVEVWGLRKRQRELWMLERFELPWKL